MSCPIPACPRPKKPQELMCKPHWWLVPKDVRDLVWSYWRARMLGDRWAKGKHEEAKRDAIAAATAAGEPPQGELL